MRDVSTNHAEIRMEPQCARSTPNAGKPGRSGGAAVGDGGVSAVVDTLTRMLMEGRCTPNEARVIEAEHDRRVTELLASNNALLERARAAERRADEAELAAQSLEADILDASERGWP